MPPSFVSRVRNAWQALWGGQDEQNYLPLEGNQQLNALRWYYENNATYDRLSDALLGLPNAPILKGTRTLGNPAHRTVEFYAAKLVPPDLMDAFEGPESLKARIEDVDKWSNWGQREKVACRWLAMYGNLFVKIASSADGRRVYRQLLDPRTVTDFETDERDFFTYLRMDTPQERRNVDGESESYTYTEVYDKANRSYQAWEHDEGADADLVDVRSQGKRVVSQTLDVAPDGDEDFAGFDFIPVVHIKFRDIGNPWGMGAFAHVLEAIDALNLALTRLDKMLFPKVHMVLKANANTRDGIPMDAPQIEASLASASSDGIATVDVDGTLMWRLPGLADLASTVPPIDFASHLAAIDQKLNHMEKDLPELAYYRLRDMQEISGRAALILLGDLIDRVREARDNFLAGIVRTNEMALTVARVLGIPEFQNLGSYEEGALEHSFAERDVFPVSGSEMAEELSLSLAAYQGAIEAGYSPDKAAEMAGLPNPPEKGRGKNGAVAGAQAIVEAALAGANGAPNGDVNGLDERE